MLKRFVVASGAAALVTAAVAVFSASTTAQAPPEILRTRTQASAPHKTANGTRLGTFAIQGYFDLERTPAGATIRGSRGKLNTRPLLGAEDKGLPSRGYTHEIFATAALPASDARYACVRMSHRVHVTYFDKAGAAHKFVVKADQNLAAEA